MAAAFTVPDMVISFVKRAFSHSNDAVTRRVSINPNVPEESLDIAFIDSLGEFAGPTEIDQNWAVRIATHFIGSIRHYRRYEVADIGVVVVIKNASKIVARKLVLLQSKRLYPINHRVQELDDFDYGMGLGLITRGGTHEAPIFSRIRYEFSELSVYGAIKRASEQCQAIASHFADTHIPVHYMLYNPVTLPWNFTTPAQRGGPSLPNRDFGARVIDSVTLQGALDRIGGNGSPNVASLKHALNCSNYTIGCSIEDFMEDVLKCKEGYRFSGERDNGINRLFNRKSGPIFCIVEVVVEDRRDRRGWLG